MDLRTIRIRQEGGRVEVIEGGRKLLDLPWQAAIDLARGIYGKAKAAEEYANADLLVLDQALLIRTGFPIGLTQNRDIQKEAVKEAVSNRNLRRYLPGGIRSKQVVGTPTLIQKEPKCLTK